MPDYFLVHDRVIFEQHLRPALAAAWRERSFSPCRALCRDWTAAARDYADRYHINHDDILLFRIEHDLPFDRAFWRTLVGELLLFAARDIPEFPTRFDTITHLLGAPAPNEFMPRSNLPPIQQALQGSRDLAFGPTLYRPEHAGYNNSSDVARLAHHLAAISTDSWTTADLGSLADLQSEEDREDELAFAREWFVVLSALYRRAAGAGQALILERIF